MGLHLLLMSCAIGHRGRRPCVAARASWLVVLALAVPGCAAEQTTRDTADVLAAVGRHFRESATPPWMILADSPRRGNSGISSVLALADTLGDPPAVVAGYTVPSIPARLARMLMVGTGPVTLLARAPETVCDSAARDPASGVRRPWIGASIRVTHLTIEGESASVTAQVDDGTDACRERRDVAWWLYDLRRQENGWALIRASRVTGPSGQEPAR